MRRTTYNVAKRAALKEEWLKLYRVLANMRNRRGKLMPGWITLQQKPIHTIKSQLVQWRKLRRMQVATGGQRGIMRVTSHTHFTAAQHVAHRRPAMGQLRLLRQPRHQGGHSRSADGDGGYGQPVATAGLRTHI